MSYSNSSTSLSKHIIDKALIQGHKLRNAMIQSILTNDPYSTDALLLNGNKHYTTPKSDSNLSKASTAKKYEELGQEEHKKITAFLKGDYMTREDEIAALETLRSMSALDLCKTTERTYCSYQSTCNCSTCKAYVKSDLNCDIRRSQRNYNEPPECITKQLQDKYISEVYKYLKYVDSVKITVQSLYLNEAGDRKVNCFNVGTNNNRGTLGETFFVEYSLPDSLSKSLSRTKSKVNSGLSDTNCIRICSRRLQNEEIHFRNISVHEITSLENRNLENISIKFSVSCRTTKQKNVNNLGCALFNFSSFEVSNNLTCCREITVKLNEKVPIVVGNLRVSLQLGCGKLYFGKEFVEAINNNKENSVVVCSDNSSVAKLTDFDYYVEEVTHDNEFSKPKKNPVHSIKSKVVKPGTDKNAKIEKAAQPKKSFQNIKIQTEDAVLSGDNFKLSEEISDKEKIILFGFLYVPEAQFIKKPLNSYVTCKPFSQGESCCSKLFPDCGNPVFNFCQNIPLVYEDGLLQKLRENFMVLEFFSKYSAGDIAIGITKLPLHQFYIAYRNPVIVKYLCQNKLPSIGTDWWEPILHPQSDEVVGQVQVLLALGTEEQIRNLELERGFKNNIVKSKLNSKPNRLETINHDKLLEIEKQRYSKNVHFKSILKHQEKIDIGTQSDMDAPKDSEATNSVADSNQVTQDMLGELINKLMTQKQRNDCVDSSTNTETPKSDLIKPLEEVQSSAAQNATNTELRKTSDLLDSLQKALSFESFSNRTGASKPQEDELRASASFRAQIVIDGALHLPSRKKCKSKKSRGKGARAEDILPSTYVTFEAIPGGKLSITKIVPKSTSPKYDYKCNIELPVELLTNNQKRLIFKLWRKSTNTVMQPHMQTDIVLGFAALDLSVLLSGLPNIQGWFNIVDFSSKCNGQLNISIIPQENLMRFALQAEPHCCNLSSPTQSTEKVELEEFLESSDEPSELLGRALKRKFTELDEITQRLRLRLSKVTNDSDTSNDDVAEEFERDINTLCVEDDFDMVDFEKEAKKVNTSHDLIILTNNSESKEKTKVFNPSELSLRLLNFTTNQETSTSSTSTNTSMDVTENSSKVNLEEQEEQSPSNATSSTTVLNKQLAQGKQRIDTLLEKLSLISGVDPTATFSNRYVSGCSATNESETNNIDTEAILKQLDQGSRPNIHPNYDPVMFQQIHTDSINSDSTATDSKASNSNSDTSLITSFSDCRAAPDGQGTSNDDKNNPPLQTD